MFGMLLDKVDGSLPGYDQERTDLYKRIPAHITPNLIPRPLPRFSLTAMENSLHGCEVLSGWRSGRKGTSFPRMLLLAYTCINIEVPQTPGNEMTTSWQSAFMLSYVILPIGNAISLGNCMLSGKDRPSRTPAPTETAKSLGISVLISRNVREVITCGEGQYLRCIYCLSKVEQVTKIYWHLVTLSSGTLAELGGCSKAKLCPPCWVQTDHCFIPLAPITDPTSEVIVT